MRTNCTSHLEFQRAACSACIVDFGKQADGSQFDRRGLRLHLTFRGLLPVSRHPESLISDLPKCPGSAGCDVAYEAESLGGDKWKYGVLRRLRRIPGAASSTESHPNRCTAKATSTALLISAAIWVAITLRLIEDRLEDSLPPISRAGWHTRS
jgi:hypothetical protein